MRECAQRGVCVCVFMSVCAFVCVCVSTCVRAHARAEVCLDCVLVLCFVMGYVFQFGEIAHKRVHYSY